MLTRSNLRYIVFLSFGSKITEKTLTRSNLRYIVFLSFGSKINKKRNIFTPASKIANCKMFNPLHKTAMYLRFDVVSKMYTIADFYKLYRVPHLDLIQSIWLWRIEICRLELVWRWFGNPEEGNLTYDSLIWLKVTFLSSTASVLREGKISLKFQQCIQNFFFFFKISK